MDVPTEPPAPLEVAFDEDELWVLLPASRAQRAIVREEGTKAQPWLVVFVTASIAVCGGALALNSALLMLGAIGLLGAGGIVIYRNTTVFPRRRIRVSPQGLLVKYGQAGLQVDFDTLTDVRVETPDDPQGDWDVELVLDRESDPHRIRLERPATEWLATFIREEWARATRLRREGSVEDVPEGIRRLVAKPSEAPQEG